METNKFDQLTGEIDIVLSEAKKIFDRENLCFLPEEKISEDLRDEIEIRVQFSNSHSAEMVMYFIDEILREEDTPETKNKNKFHHSFDVENDDDKELSNRDKIYEKVKAEYDELKNRFSYKRELINLTGNARKQKALEILGKEYRDFLPFTIQDAEQGKHIEILNKIQRICEYKIWKFYREQYQRDKYQSQLSEIENNFIEITNKIKNDYEIIFPQVLRELNKIAIDAGDTTKELKVIKFYESEFERQLKSIIDNKTRLLGTNHNVVLDKGIIKAMYLESISEMSNHKGRLSDKRKSYFFYIFLTNTLYQILEPIKAMRVDLTKQSEPTANTNNPKPPGHKAQTIAEIHPVDLAYVRYFKIQARAVPHFSGGNKLKEIAEICKGYNKGFAKNFEIKFNLINHNRTGKAYRESGKISNIQVLTKVCEMLKDTPAAFHIANETLRIAMNNRR